MSKENRYAVVKAGGKQYRVKAGQKIKVEKLSANEGDTVKLDNILLVGAEDGEIGSVKGVSVNARVLKHALDKKVIIFKKRRTKGYTKKQGHRQLRTELLVESIEG